MKVKMMEMPDVRMDDSSRAAVQVRTLAKHMDLPVFYVVRVAIDMLYDNYVAGDEVPPVRMPHIALSELSRLAHQGLVHVYVLPDGSVEGKRASSKQPPGSKKLAADEVSRLAQQALETYMQV